MPQRQAFLDAISSEPDQDRRRLDFADWLEGQGQAPRAELIRLQCQLEHLAPDEDRAREIRQRADDLLVEHEIDWLGEWAGRLVRWQFRRGFLHEATLLPGAFLQGPSLMREHPIYRISFVDEQGDPAPPEAVLDLVASEEMARVRSLDLSCGSERSPWSNGRGSRANPAWARSLACSDHISVLEELIFADSESPGESFLGKEELRLLAGANHLKTLRRLDLGDAWHNPNLDSEAIRILTTASFVDQLQHLDLRDCPIGESGLGLLATDRAFASLKTLSLPGCEVTARGVKSVLESSTLENLEDLRMDLEVNLPALATSTRLARFRSLVLHPYAPPDPPDALSETFWLMIAGIITLDLQSLTLDGCRISRTGLEALASAPGLANLRESRCRHIRASAEMDWRFLAAGGLQHLTVLDLSDSCGSDLDWLANWPGLARLVELDLSGCSRLSNHLQTLLDSPHFGRSLQSLGLVSCDLEESNILALANCPGLARLKSLRLNWQSLTARSIEALATSPWLQRLEKLHLAGHPLQRVEAGWLEKSGCLTRLRDVAISASARGPMTETLRRRFGPSLRLLHP